MLILCVFYYSNSGKMDAVLSDSSSEYIIINVNFDKIKCDLNASGNGCGGRRSNGSFALNRYPALTLAHQTIGY